MTYPQAAAHGGRVRRGEAAVRVLLVRTSETTRRDATGEEETVTRTLPKRYPVFDCEQIDGPPPQFYAPTAVPDPSADGYAVVRAFFADLGRTVVGLPARGAGYDPVGDVITMPTPGRFAAEGDSWATLPHRVVDWTRHGSRPDRNFGRRTWGDAGYAREELVAEIGAAFLCAEPGPAPVVRKDHAQYISAWLRKLDDNPQAVFEATHHASAAAQWITERVRSGNRRRPISKSWPRKSVHSGSPPIRGCSTLNGRANRPLRITGPRSGGLLDRPWP